MTEPFHLDIRENLNEITSNLTLVEREQFPFAMGKGLTNTADKGLNALQSHMDQVFDRPTKYTKRSFYVKPAKKNDRSVSINAREFAGKGTPGYKYLMPEAYGGGRRMKRFERALSPLSGGQYAIPARGAKLDRYGNVSRGQVVKVLSRLKAAESTAGYKANASKDTIAKLRKRKKTVATTGHTSDYFVARSKTGGKPLGIYQLKRKGAVEPVFIFTQKRPKYDARFMFERTVTVAFNTHFKDEFGYAMQHAVRTAR